MKNNTLQQFVELRRRLTEEKTSLQTRLQQINQALGETAAAEVSGPMATVSSPPAPSQGEKPNAQGGSSLRELVFQVLQTGAKTKEETLAAVQSMGYQFRTKNPLNSLGIVLYGKNPKLTRVDGRFALPGESVAQSEKGRGRTGGRRSMSPEGRARIAAAQKARWAASRKNHAAKPAVSLKVSDRSAKKRFSPAARRALAEAARKRWAAAKTSGKSSL